MNDISPIALITEQDLGKALQETALLASVTISVWSATVTDRKLLETLKHQHNAKGDVGRLIKNIYAGADEPLKQTISAYNAVRQRHYELTMPWVSNPNADRKTGPRLLPHPLFERYLQEIGQLIITAQNQLEEFLPKLPAMEQVARSNLGSMADLVYPTIDEVRSRFSVWQDFEPIPDGHSFKGLPDKYLDRLGKMLDRRQQRRIDAATASMWDQVKERVSHLVNRLADEDNTFKEASVRNVRELVELLPGWNITRDPRITEVVRDISTMLDGVEAVDLRKDARLRASTAADAKKITEKLSQWGIN
jgi:hypothetical protein